MSFVSSMTRQLARVLRVPARFVPSKIPASILVYGANRLLESQELSERLEEVEGASICLHVTDVDLQLMLKVRDCRLVAAEGDEWDMRIAGHLNEFLALATRAEDPDTLFFNRSLILEGKTEIGLYIKNLLDAVDLAPDKQLQALTGITPPEPVRKVLQKAESGIRKLWQTLH